MPNISEIFVMDMSTILPYSDTKYCICVSVSENLGFLINSDHREMYDDFKIKASDYKFLNHDSYVGCSETFEISEDFILSIKPLGNLNYDDMKKILEKIRNSKHFEEQERKNRILELEEWLNENNYAGNKLKNAFNNR
jgi:thioester reductase-like protein